MDKINSSFSQARIFSGSVLEIEQELNNFFCEKNISRKDVHIDYPQGPMFRVIVYYEEKKPGS